MNDSSSRVFPCAVLLIKSPELVCPFFQSLLQTDVETCYQPCLHYVQKVSSQSTIIMVNSSACEETTVRSVSLVAVRKVYVMVNSVESLVMRATECGGQVIESNIGAGTCTIGGPEGFVVHACIRVCKIPGSVWLMNSLVGKAGDEDEDSELSAQITASRQSIAHARPIIHTLDVTLMSMHHPQGFTPCPPNSRRPIPFETEIFKGEALLVVRTNPLDMHYRNFFSGKKMFEVQVQGQFKKVPQGPVYVGADAENKLELGLLTRSFCRVILQFVMTMVRNLHYSFGETPVGNDYEISHIVAPLFSTMDKIVVTPAGEKPPPVGIPFPEDMEFRKLRLNPSTVESIVIDTTSTYSFSVNTANMDLCSWMMVNIPMLRDLNLNTFSGGCPVRLVGYEVPVSGSGVESKYDCRHPYKKLNYVFNLKITSVDTDKGIELELDASEDDLDAEEFQQADEEGLTDDFRPDHIDDEFDAINDDTEGYQHDPEEEDILTDDDDEEDDGEGVGEGESRSRSPWRRRFLRRPARQRSASTSSNETAEKRRWRRQSGSLDASPDKGVRGWFRKEIGELFHTDAVIGDSTDPREGPANDFFMEQHEEDLRFCPGCIEFADHRKDGRRKIMYIFAYANELSKLNRDTSPKIRSYQEFTKKFPTCRYGRLAKSVRLSSIEKLRRQLVVSYRALITSGDRTTISKLEEFLGHGTETDRTFLEKSRPVSVSAKGPGSYSNRWEGSVALATDRRFWIERTLLVSGTQVCLLRNADARKSSGITFALSSVLHVEVIREKERPFDGFGFFQIETFARVFILMVISEADADAWVKTFVKLLGPTITSPANLTNHPIPNLMESGDIFFGRPSGYKLDRRRVLNYRRIIFRPTSGLSPDILRQSPNHLVEGMLEKAFELVATGAAADAALWVEFMDRLCALQTLDVTGINRREKVALLLNLYHTMVLHGFLLLGPPVSQSSWASFFNSVSYLVAYDVIAINELEHNGLRAAMCKPSSALLSKKIGAKQSNLGILALDIKDFRLSFCINCGSRSLPGFVPIYYPDCVDLQMDEMTTLVLAETCQVDAERRDAVLPRICSWYLRDFSKRRHGSLPIDCLRVIMPYLRDADRSVLLRLLEDGSAPNIRFRPFAFRCRPIAKLEGITTSSSPLSHPSAVAATPGERVVEGSPSS